jgi:hypothetical protein
VRLSRYSADCSPLPVGMLQRHAGDASLLASTSGGPALDLPCGRRITHPGWLSWTFSDTKVTSKLGHGT